MVANASLYLAASIVARRTSDAERAIDAFLDRKADLMSILLPYVKQGARRTDKMDYNRYFDELDRMQEEMDKAQG